MTPDECPTLSHTRPVAVLSLWRGVMEVRAIAPSMKVVAEAVAARHGLTMDDLRARARDGWTSSIRQEAMWEVRRQTGVSFPRIGTLFNRDHTTVLHGVRAHERRRTFVA